MRPLTSDGSVSVTYGNLAQRVRRIAAGLAALGVRRGDTVGIMLTNRPEFHIVDLAVMHLGVVAFSVYITLALGQIAYMFADAGNKIVITETSQESPTGTTGGEPAASTDVEQGEKSGATNGETPQDPSKPIA